MSTDHIFNGKKKGYYSENNKADPLNYYSKTKFLADNFTKDYKKALIVRTNFFGGYTKNKKSFSELILDKIRKKISRLSRIKRHLLTLLMEAPERILMNKKREKGKEKEGIIKT